jgi:DNA-3-methyladenine glycosylase II
MAKQTRRPTRPHELSSRYRAAERHLAASHPALARVIATVGPCTLRPNPDLFHILTQTVISQQISTKAAVSIGRRFEEIIGGPPRSAAAVLARSDDELRAAGLSAGKLKSIRAIASRVADRTLDLHKLAGMADDEVAAALRSIHGLGPWSVDMVLIFGLGRLDVLPVGDLGFRFGVRDLIGLKEAPSPAELLELAEPWRPYRTIATWYFWRSRGFVPQSSAE